MVPAPPARPVSRTSSPNGIGRWLANALPDMRTAWLGSIAWALSMGLVALVELVWMRWYEPQRIAAIAALFAAGGLLAFLPAVYLGRLLSRGRRDAGFAATFLALGTGTIGLTGLLVGLEYRSYYAAWHEDAFSIVWVFQFIFTVGAAVYQFLVLGVRIYVPLGLVLLAAASLWNVRSMR